MKSIAEFKFLIDEACPECPEPPECGELYVDWPDAEPDEKIVYIGPDALFAASCSKGHAIEFYLAELKAGEVIAHTRIERTLGKKLPQLLCPHKKVFKAKLEEGVSTQGLLQILTGPCEFTYCLICGAKRLAEPPPPQTGKSKVIWTP